MPNPHHSLLGFAGGDAFAAGGFDSLSAVELSSTLSSTLKLQLPGTLVFDYPSVSAMAAYIHSQLVPAQQVEAPMAMAHSIANQAAGLSHELEHHAPLHIDMIASLPVGNARGSANTLTPAADGIHLVPFGRWDLEALQASSPMDPGFDQFLGRQRQRWHALPLAPLPSAPPNPLPACRAPGRQCVLVMVGS